MPHRERPQARRLCHTGEAPFKRGQGIPYSAYKRFHHVMAEESAQTTVAGLLEHIVPLVPNSRDQLDAGIEVLDVGCGAGGAVNILAEYFPNSRFLGYDLCPEAIELARPDVVLANIHRALRPGGTFLMQDIGASSHVHENISHPIAPFIYTISCMHCMSVALTEGGMGLGAAWGKQKALEMLAEAGFVDVRIETLDHDMLNYYYLARK